MPNLILSSNEVHIWRASLDQIATYLDQRVQVLSPDERLKAERFYFERDRRRFIAGRGILRTILGRYLGMDPSQLRFCYGPGGKPYLAEKPIAGMISFNLSHSRELAIFAFVRECRIGVDLEYKRPVADAEQIAARFFSAYENAVLRRLQTSQKQEAFFNCWTRKEAYIKAIGDGLAYPLDRFDVSLTPGEPARLLSVERDPGQVSRWSLEVLMPAPGYAAALAVEGHDWDHTCWQYRADHY